MVPAVLRPALALLLVLAGSASASVQAPKGESARGADGRLAALAVPPPAAAWRDLIERDRSLQFTARTAIEARAVLGVPGMAAERRAAAFVALGCASDDGQRPLLESTARAGSGVERAAAILALGEMNAGATELLLDLAVGETGLVRECALLALLRDGRNAGRRRVEEIAADPAHPASLAARDLLVHVFDPAASSPTPAGAVLVRLRYEAAREFGLVGGTAWRVAAVRELAADAELLTEVVVGAQSGGRRVGTADHVLELVLRGSGLARLRAAVTVMPRELSDLVANGLWLPAQAEEWRVLLAEIRDRRVERLLPDLVRAAVEEPEFRWRAVELLGLAGENCDRYLASTDPSELTPIQRVGLAQALGGVREASWLTRFQVLREDPDPLVRAAYLVAGLRHDQRKATAEVEERLGDPAHPERPTIIEALQRVARDARASALLEGLLEELAGRQQLAVAVALARAGSFAGRAVVREALSSDPPPRGVAAVELVRALSTGGTSEDIELYRTLFPRPDDRELDVELARTLAASGDRSVEPLLRAALWEAEFDVSLLAAGLLFDNGGAFALTRELVNPPVGASSGDLRRVGFAIGLWGGTAEYERLARELRATSAHPGVQGAWMGALASRTR